MPSITVFTPPHPPGQRAPSPGTKGAQYAATISEIDGTRFSLVISGYTPPVHSRVLWNSDVFEVISDGVIRRVVR